MRGVLLGLILCFFFPAPGPAKRHAAPAAEEQVETLPDFSTVRNPFLSQLPADEINKTGIESRPLSGNNVPIPIPRPQPAVPPPAFPARPPAAYVPPPAAKPSMPQIKVQGIIWDSEHPQAIVNNAIVGVGERVDNIQIKSINKNGIDVLFQGEKFHVNIED